MPYRISTHPIEERRDELEAMLAGKPLAFKTNEPARLRYRLHEALHAARVLSIEPYASLNVTIRVRAPYVYVTPSHEIQVQVVEQAVTERDFAIFPDVRTALDAVNTLRTRPELLELRFPEYDDDTEPLLLFAKGRGYEVLLEPFPVLRRKG